MFGQLLPNKNKQVTVATVRGRFGRRQLGAQLNKASNTKAKLGEGQSNVIGSNGRWQGAAWSIYRAYDRA